ncbi:macrolide family glycosyltransferase [Pontibacillus salicampi]|uniref:Macrolide family glycosyltransferase n=1 Tax=Pontibacillus salicampi TaxID=1449801 RepID=A0ABV6LIT0_9BACI
MNRNILMLNIPAEGHVNPSLGMIEAFVANGDCVHYITTDHYQERIENLGASVHVHHDYLKHAHIDPASSEGILSFLHVHLHIALDTLAIVKRLREEITFDYVYYDSFGTGELISTYLNIPGFSSSASFVLPEEWKHIIPLHPNHLPPLDAKANQMLAEMREEYGVAPRNMLQFMNNQGALTFAYTSAYFQPQRDQFGEEFIFIGPSFPERKHTQNFPVASLQESNVIFISLGTVLSNVEEFFNKCIDAFKDFDGKIVMATGARADYDKLQEIPEHFLIYPYVPQLEVLPYADIFITHGGMNSVNEAIQHNVPMLIIPHDKDQPMVAQRLMELGAAQSLQPSTLTPALLQQGVKEVLDNSEYTQGIARIKESFQQSPGPKHAVNQIEDYLKNE